MFFRVTCLPCCIDPKVHPIVRAMQSIHVQMEVEFDTHLKSIRHKLKFPPRKKALGMRLKLKKSIASITLRSILEEDGPKIPKIHNCQRRMYKRSDLPK